MKWYFILGLYYLFINIVSFFVYGIDKTKAVGHKWRIKESSLLLFSFMGGCLGAFFAMHFFHHKTKKTKFRILVPLSIILHISILVFLFTFSGFKKNEDRIVKYKDNKISSPEIELGLLTKNKNSRPGKKLKKIKGLVIHYTANPGTDAYENRNYFENKKDKADTLANKVSSHFVIGLDGTIVQCIPLSEIAYASNSRNVDTISIECCHPDNSGKFNQATRKALIHLSAWLCYKYNIKKKNVIRHYDVTGKMCPKYYVKNPKEWRKLKKDIFEFRQNDEN